MSTPIINLVENSNDDSVETVLSAVADNENAVESIHNSQRNIEAIASSGAASDGLGVNDDAARISLCILEDRDPDNYPDFDSIASDGSFMSDIASRRPASLLMTASTSGATSVVNNDSALDEVLSSEPALDAVSASQTARGVFKDAMLTTTEADPAQSNFYIAELEGGGGGPGGSTSNGGDGGDTTLGPIVAEGGEGGSAGGSNGDDGGFTVPDDGVLLEGIVGGGADGNNGSGGTGGDGGYVKATYINVGGDGLSLSVGDGGNSGDDTRDDGDDGSATVWYFDR